MERSRTSGCARGGGRDLLQDGVIGVERFVLVLVVVGADGAPGPLDLALAGREVAGGDLEEGALAAAVRPHEDDLLGALDMEVDTEQDKVLAVGVGDAAADKHVALGAARRFEAEGDRGLLAGPRDALDLRDLALAALDGGRLGGLRAEALDEALLPGDLPLLAGGCAILSLELVRLLALVGAVVARVRLHGAIAQVEDATRDPVQEVAVVGDNQERAGVLAQLAR